MDKFKIDSNYKDNLNFTRVKFGFDKPVLESELNEMQIIQEKNITSLSKSVIPSGFVEKIIKGFDGKELIVNTQDSSYVKYNSIAIAPFKAYINGYELQCYGNETHNNRNGYIGVDLGEASETGQRDDLVYLECWFETINEQSILNKYGYLKGTHEKNPIVDPRVNFETSRRIVLKWDVKVAKGVDFDKFQDGFGYDSQINASYIYASTNEKVKLTSDINLVFASSSNIMFKGCDFYKDANLWVAGRPDYELPFSDVYGKYVFALPMFKVSRRNSTAYSLDNPNGSLSIKNYSVDTNGNNITSEVLGDIKLGVRPDGYFHDRIEHEDIVDLRKTVLIKNNDNVPYLNNTLKSLFNGELDTKCKKTTRRVQFGNKQPVYSHESIEYINKFDKSYIPSVFGIDSPTVSHKGAEPVYKESLNRYGIYLNNDTEITTQLGLINTTKGTIDMFIKPLWNGDSNCNQFIFGLFDNNNNLVYSLYKEDSKLIFLHKKYAVEHYDNNDKIIIDLSNTLLFANNYYHFRMSWTSTQMMFYINGKMVGKSKYSKGEMTPDKIKFGSIDTSCDGVVLEDFILYSNNFEASLYIDGYRDLVNKYWPNLPNDFINSDSLLRESFNGLVNCVSDNLILQENTIYKLSYEEGHQGQYRYSLNLLDGYVINNDKPITVYDLEGNLVVGNWTDIQESKAYFTTNVKSKFLIVKFEMAVSPASGGNDLFEEILRATFKSKNSEEPIEISYNKKGADPRKVNVLLPKTTKEGHIDYMMDFNSDRDSKQCFTRLLYHYIEPVIDESTGKPIKRYEISPYLYGYKVEGILGCNAGRIKQISRDRQGKFIIEFASGVEVGQIVEFQVALGGYSFEYETQSKTMFNKMLNMRTIRFEGDGVSKEFLLGCYNENGNSGIVEGAEPIKYGVNIYCQNVLSAGGSYNNDGDLICNGVEVEAPFNNNYVSFICAKQEPRGNFGEWWIEKRDLNYKFNNTGEQYVNYESVVVEFENNKIKKGESIFNGIDGVKIMTDISEHHLININPLNSEQGENGEFFVVKHEDGFTVYNTGSKGNAFEWITVDTDRLSNVEVADLKLSGKEGAVYREKIGEEYSVIVSTPVLSDEEIDVLSCGKIGDISFDKSMNKVAVYNTGSAVGEVKIIIFKEVELPPVGPDDVDITGGVLHSVYNFNENILDINDLIIEQENNYCAFVDGKMFKKSGDIYKFELDASSLGTPFIKVTFDDIIPSGAIVEIPVLVSYQPSYGDELSIWYKYTPYQGVLSNKSTNVKRVSDWKYFITTLSSGKKVTDSNLNNVINRLPGGLSSAYKINGSIIDLEGTNITNKEDINPRLIFVNDVMYDNNENNLSKLFELDCDLTISKTANSFQDGMININNSDFKVYLPDTKNNINKYVGMACLVMKDNELMLLVLGNLDETKPSKLNYIKPQFGDLYKINNLPTL